MIRLYKSGYTIYDLRILHDAIIQAENEFELVVCPHNCDHCRIKRSCHDIGDFRIFLEKQLAIAERAEKRNGKK